MLTYELVVKNGNTEEARFAREIGESKKGTYKTLSATTGNKAIPFGKLYVAENEIKPAKKTEKKS